MLNSVMTWLTVVLTIVMLNAVAARAKMVFGGPEVLAITAFGLCFALWAPHQLEASEVGYTLALVTWTTSLVLIIGAPLAPDTKEVNTGPR